MLNRMGIGIKLSVVTGIVTAVIFGAVLWQSATKLNTVSRDRVYEAVTMEGRIGAEQVQARLGESLRTARNLAEVFAELKLSAAADRDTAVHILRAILQGHPDYLGVWVAFEPNAFDGKDQEYGNAPGHDATGRFIPYLSRSEGKILHNPLENYDKPDPGDYYLKARNSGRETIINPFVYKVGGKDVLLISLCVPVKVNDQVIGVAGVDLNAKQIQDIVAEVKPMGQGYAFLFSNNTTYVAHPKAEQVGKTILEVRSDAHERDRDVRQGRPRVEEITSLVTGEVAYYVFTPIRIGTTDTPWSLAVTVNISTLLADARNAMTMSAVYGVLGLFLILALLFILNRVMVTRPMRSMVTAAHDFAQGDFHRRLEIASGDEIGQAATYLNKAFDIVVDKAFWYESLLDSISFPISVTDMNRNWTFINKAAEQVAGKKRTEVLGQQCHNWGADICRTERCGIECLLRGQSTSTFTQPGLERDFQVDVSFLFNRKGEKIGHIEVVQDITEANRMRRRAEEAMREGILSAASKLEGIVERVTSSSQELSAQVEQISLGADRQKQRMDETATAMEEMNATVMEVARNATEAARSAETAKDKALTGADVVKRAVQAIQDVRAKTMTMNENLALLGHQAESIGQVMNVINDIADQTNLLALNAAIEAARAGEAGRGFAVVADEVRKLAEKTMGATKEVGANIHAIQEATRKNITEMNTAGDVVARATELSEESGRSLAEIVSLVEASTGQVQSIASAAEEQSAASEEINRSIEEVNRVADETATSMRHSSQAVGELAGMAQELRSLIEEMKSGA